MIPEGNPCYLLLTYGYAIVFGLVLSFSVFFSFLSGRNQPAARESESESRQSGEREIGSLGGVVCMFVSFLLVLLCCMLVLLFRCTCVSSFVCEGRESFHPVVLESARGHLAVRN